jgi:hypothetical protein
MSVKCSIALHGKWSLSVIQAKIVTSLVGAMYHVCGMGYTEQSYWVRLPQVFDLRCTLSSSK